MYNDFSKVFPRAKNESVTPGLSANLPLPDYGRVARDPPRIQTSQILRPQLILRFARPGMSNFAILSFAGRCKLRSCRLSAVICDYSNDFSVLAELHELGGHCAFLILVEHHDTGQTTHHVQEFKA